MAVLILFLGLQNPDSLKLSEEGVGVAKYTHGGAVVSLKSQSSTRDSGSLHHLMARSSPLLASFDSLLAASQLPVYS